MENNSNKNVLWIILGVVALGLLIWWMMTPKAEVSPVINDTTASTQDSSGTADISAQLNGLNDADLNAEFNDVTQDVSKL